MRLVDAVDQADVEIAGRGEIAFVGKIRTLADLERIDRLRHQPVQVRIALAVRMGAHVDRHVVDRDRQVGAVIEIIAAQEILVGFALAAVLRHDQAGHGLQNFSRPRHRRALSSSPVTVIWLAMFGGADRPRADIGRAGCAMLAGWVGRLAIRGFCEAGVVLRASRLSGCAGFGRRRDACTVMAAKPDCRRIPGRRAGIVRRAFATRLAISTSRSATDSRHQRQPTQHLRTPQPPCTRHDGEARSLKSAAVEPSLTIAV